MNCDKTEYPTPYTTLIPITKCPAGSKGKMQPCSQSLPMHTRQMCCRKSCCTYVARKVQLPKGSKSNIIGLLLIQLPQIQACCWMGGQGTAAWKAGPDNSNLEAAPGN